MARSILYNKQKNHFQDEESGEHMGWSILVREEEYQRTATLDTIQDVSTDKDVVDRIVKKLNSGDVSLYHLRDIIEDLMP